MQYKNTYSKENVYKSGNRFKVQKYVDGKVRVFGIYDSEIEGIIVRNFLAENNWDVYKINDGDNVFKEDDIYYILFGFKDRIYSLGKFETYEDALKNKDILIEKQKQSEIVSPRKERYIWHTKNGYEVRKRIDGNMTVFGFYSSRDDAIAAREEFINNNWQDIPENSVFNEDNQDELDRLNEIIFSLSPIQKMVLDVIDSFDKATFTLDDLKNSKSNLNRFILKNKADSKLYNILIEFIDLGLIKQIDEGTFEKLSLYY